MANTITVSNTFTPNTKALSSEVNTNFNNIVSGLSSNTKDINPATIWLRDLTITTDTVINSGDSIASFCYMAYPDTTTGLTVTLPTASASDGRVINIVNADGNGPVSIVTPDTATTIDSFTGTSGIILPGKSSSFLGICGASSYVSLAKTNFSRTLDAGDANYTILDNDEYKTIISSPTADRTITLPPIASNIGREITIIRDTSDGFATIIDGNSSETIDGFSTIQMSFQNDTITLIATSDGWYCKEGNYQSEYTTTAPSNAGTSPSGVVKYSRRGKVISLSVRITTGSTGSPTTPTWSGLLLTWARANSSYSVMAISRVSSGQNAYYAIETTSNGTINLYKTDIDASGNISVVNWANSESFEFNVTYHVD